MYRRIGITCLGLMMIYPIFGQATSTSPKYVEINNTVGEMLSYAFQIRPEGRYVELKGSPYLEDTWTEGEILLSGDTVNMRFPMRYNIYGNEMQFIYDQDTFAVSNPMRVDEIRLDNKRFVYRPFHHRNVLNMAYFEIIEDGEFQLLIRRETVLEAGQTPVTPYHSQIDRHGFQTHKFYYFQTKNMEEPILIPDSRAKLLRMEPFIMYDDLIREMHIHPANERDLESLFSRINSELK